MRVAIATSSVVPPEFDDDGLIVEALRARGAEAEFVDWDQAGAGWERFDLVVIRSTWDYPRRLDEFLEWVGSVGERLRNEPELIRWNSDKRYLADLVAAGIAIVPTRFVGPRDNVPSLFGEVVVKPTVSAGGRDTGRFGPTRHGEATALAERIAAEGRTAMVQPYLDSVDRRGETALVHVAGEFVHALRKRAVLRPDEEAPLRDDPLASAEAMYDPDLVRAAEAEDDEIAFAAEVIAYLSDRFSGPPLYARVDVARNEDGNPVLMELEAIEPCLYLHEAPTTAKRLAEAILAEL
ncbi:MAG: ATP-grasp domain-containing protein [Solirubrobacterales bacterium]